MGEVKCKKSVRKGRGGGSKVTKSRRKIIFEQLLVKFFFIGTIRASHFRGLDMTGFFCQYFV